MPPRLDLRTKRWSILDLPILPFLAPRVFQPWPWKGRRAYSATTHAAQQKFEEDGIDRDSSGSSGSKHWSPISTEKQGSLEFPEFNNFSSHAANHNHTLPSGIGSSHGMNIERDAYGTKSSAETLERDAFSKIYEETWGSVPKDGPHHPAKDFVPLRERARDVKERNRNQVRAAALAQMAARRRIVATERHKAMRRMKIPRVRPKWVRYPVGTDPLIHGSFSSWHRQFAILNSRHEQFMKGRKLPNYGFPTAQKFTTEFILKLIDHESSETLSLEWDTFDARLRMEIWPQLMLMALEYHPEKALKVMAATYNEESLPPCFAFSDCLNYVISYFFDENVPLRTLELPGTALAEQIFDYVFRLLGSGPTDYLQISQNSVHLLLSNSSYEWQSEKLYLLLAELGHPLHENTLIHFGHCFAKVGNSDLVFEVLQKLKNLQCDFNTPKMLSLCSTILDASLRLSDTAGSDSDRLEYMLQCGMQPNIIHYNILLQNALRRGDHNTGWQLHGMMIDSGLEPDAYTYSLLLKDSKQRMDPEAIKTVMDIVREKGIKSKYIVTNVMHAISLLHRQRTENGDQPSESGVASRDMLKVYLENFHMEPLATIIPWIAEILPQIQSPETTPTHLDHPSAPALALMIAAFLQDVQTSSGLKMFYGHFRELVSNGDPAVASLLNTTHIWDSVIMGLGKFHDGLRDCPAVIGDMLSPVNTTIAKIETATGHHYTPLKVEDRESETPLWEAFNQPSNSSKPSLEKPDSASLQPENIGAEPRKPHTPPKPSVYTWSVLLNVFGRHRQTRAAERVLAMMREKGVHPSLVTWNSLLDSYASLQDTEMAVDVVSRMEASGIETDEVTMSVLRKIRDRQGVVKAMKRSSSVVDPRRDFVAQLRDDMEQDRLDELVHGVQDLLNGVKEKATEVRASEHPTGSTSPEYAPTGPLSGDSVLSNPAMPLKPEFKRFVFKDLASLPAKLPTNLQVAGWRKRDNRDTRRWADGARGPKGQSE